MLVWENSNKGPKYYPDVDYYAYYPYQTSLVGDVDISATDASGFFANIIGEWQPASDQSTHEKYTAQDLMIAKGVFDNKNLSFGMKHQMALVVIELPGIRYSFSNINPSVSDYIIDPLDTQFDNFSPCRMEDGTYRYLVRPSQASLTFTGGYTDPYGKNKGWRIETNISNGMYKYFKIEGELTSVSRYNLQAGDFMMKDGTLIGKDATLTQAQKDACIGIVFWVGDPTKGAHNNGTQSTDFDGTALRKEQPQCTHGLVVALKDASAGVGMLWQNTLTAVSSWTNSNTPYGSIAAGTGENDALNKLRGYNNTRSIRAYNANGDNTSKVLPVQAIDTWAVSTLVPTTGSGWYLPSEKELTLLCGKDVNNIWSNNSGGTGMSDVVNGQLTKLGSHAATIQAAYYWSGSESALHSDNVLYVYFSNGYVDRLGKVNGRSRVRAILAF